MMRLPIDRSTTAEAATAIAAGWVAEHLPLSWRTAAAEGGAQAIRLVRSRASYEAWYPVFAESGLVVPTWPVEYGGLDVAPNVARAIEQVLAPYNLGRLNPLGLNNAAPALFSHGTEEQRLRFFPPLVRAEELWCQLFSEPGAGSDLASLATRAVRDGDSWIITGQKVWSTWAHLSDWAILLARTDTTVPKRQGITYFLLDLRLPGVDVRPLRHLTGEIDFSEAFLDGVVVPDFCRVGKAGNGWAVANSTLSGERQMVAGSGSGGVDRIGGAGTRRLAGLGRERGRADDQLTRQRIVALHAEERIREWTNRRVRAGLKAGRPPGPASSIGKVHQGSLNQRIQMLATDLLGPSAIAWEQSDGATGAPSEAAVARYARNLPYEVQGMLRSRANTIEGGTTEVNKNILGERVLGLPREPDPYVDSPWSDVPRS